MSVIYRHPGGFYAKFQEKLTKVMHKFNQSNTQLVLVGDYSIDLSKQTSDTKVCNYINKIYSSGCYSLINKPTRITTTSATTLDHVYTNSFHKVAVAGVLILDFSDHLPTFCVINGNACKNYLPRKVTRAMKNFTVECFCEDINKKLASMPLRSDDDLNLAVIFLVQ